MILITGVSRSNRRQGASQTGQVDNIWEAGTSYANFTASGSEPVEITFTPSGGNNRVFLNGFEVDGVAMGEQISFPFPENKNERIETEDGSVSASWRAPADVEGATYDVYLGTEPDALEVVESGLTEAQVTFSCKSSDVIISRHRLLTRL